MEGLQRAGKGVEEGNAGACVGEGVDGGDEEVEGEAPVGEYGEVGEGLADVDKAACGLVGGFPADVEERGEEGV